jgi:uncharacterized FlaG/YvyC family protein
MNFKEYLVLENSTDDEISKSELNVIEKQLDKLFSDLGIDIEFSRHFLVRLNDPRNKKQITANELVQIYQDVKSKFGTKLSKSSGEIEKLIKSASTDINIPVAIKYDRKTKEVDITAITIMRKKGFKSPTPILQVESFTDYLKL